MHDFTKEIRPIQYNLQAQKLELEKIQHGLSPAFPLTPSLYSN